MNIRNVCMNSDHDVQSFWWYYADSSKNMTTNKQHTWHFLRLRDLMGDQDQQAHHHYMMFIILFC